MISVLEKSSDGKITFSSEEFKSWRKANEYFNGDLLHSLDCPQTKRLTSQHRNTGHIFHFGHDYHAATHICESEQP